MLHGLSNHGHVWRGLDRQCSFPPSITHMAMIGLGEAPLLDDWTGNAASRPPSPATTPATVSKPLGSCLPVWRRRLAPQQQQHTRAPAARLHLALHAPPQVAGVGYCLRCWVLGAGALMVATQLVRGQRAAPRRRRIHTCLPNRISISCAACCVGAAALFGPAAPPHTHTHALTHALCVRMCCVARLCLPLSKPCALNPAP